MLEVRDVSRSTLARAEVGRFFNLHLLAVLFRAKVLDGDLQCGNLLPFGNGLPI
jgi:hypothetical protein